MSSLCTSHFFWLAALWFLKPKHIGDTQLHDAFFCTLRRILVTFLFIFFIFIQPFMKMFLFCMRHKMFITIKLKLVTNLDFIVWSSEAGSFYLNYSIREAIFLPTDQQLSSIVTTNNTKRSFVHPYVILCLSYEGDERSIPSGC